MVTATTRGPRVFVSHASADGKYVKSFVEDILLRGAGSGPPTSSTLLPPTWVSSRVNT